MVNEPLATVIIPTYDHGETICFAVESALSQTISELEIVIIGDGVPDFAKPAIKRCLEDSRVRFLEHPKSARKGEEYRHSALETVTSKIVCYLSDDDLWLPNHLETMLGILSEADFAVSRSIACYPGGPKECKIWWSDVEGDAGKRLLAERTGPPLSTGGHTLEAYKRLQEGWTTTPPGIQTDLFFWNKFISDGNFALRSGGLPTVLKFCSISRKGWSNQARASELAEWSQLIKCPQFRSALMSNTLGNLFREQARTIAAARSAAKYWQERTDELKASANC
jgi:GalNAc5-diNAcBac-PP-undecaprenol beta-1,3-glucosyltransferase